MYYCAKVGLISSTMFYRLENKVFRTGNDFEDKR